MNIKIDQIIRSCRRTIALIIEPDGRLIVRAPLRAPDSFVRQFVESKSDWITKKQAALCQQAPIPQKKFSNGEMFSYLGKTLPLAITERERPSLAFDGKQFVLSQKSIPLAREAFTRLYKKLAQAHISARAQELAQKYGYRYQKLRISSARTRWGSCSSNGTISFTWRLVMAPAEVIDYVIVHELVHLKIKNHSKKFWSAVAEHMPDYKKHVEYLKKNGKYLTL